MLFFWLTLGCRHEPAPSSGTGALSIDSFGTPTAMSAAVVESLPPCDSVVATGWCTLEVRHFTWRAGQGSYDLVIERPLDSAAMGDIGTRLRIRTPSGIERSFYDTIGPGGITEIDSHLDSTLLRESPLASAYLLATSRIRSPAGDPVLFAFGWGYASDQATFRVIGLNADGVPYEVLFLEHFGLTNIRDLDGDGQAELLGFQWMSEGFGRCYWTYNPVFVLSFPRTPSPFHGRIDLPLSARYNREEGNGWAGSSPSEEMVYVECAPGGKRLMRVSDADTLTIPGH